MGWLSGYQYRKRVTISGSSGAGQNYQVKLLIGSSQGGDFHLEGHCVNFPDDMRFTSGDGVTLLDYWIENPEEDPIVAWVKVRDSLDDDVDIYCYYHNLSAGSASDGHKTFILFDDFEYEDEDADTAMWTPRYELGSSGGHADIGITEAGKLRVNEEYSSGGNWYAVQADGQELPENFVVEVDFNVERLGMWDMDAAVTLEVRDTSQLTGETGFVEIGRGIVNNTNYIWMRKDNTDEIHVESSANTGKLRLRKSGRFFITGDYDTGSGWERLGTYSIAYNAFYLGLTAKLLNGSPLEYVQATCYWDNIRVRKYVSPEPSFSDVEEEEELKPIKIFRAKKRTLIFKSQRKSLTFKAKQKTLKFQSR